MNCYDEWWLPRDMENMGYIFEYCDKYCEEIYGVKIDKVKFLTDFMNSKLRKAMEEGHPGLLSQAGKTTVRKYVDVDCDGDTSKYKINKRKNYIFNQWYWVGWMYAYLHFVTKLSSKELLNKLSIDTMLNLYHLGHEQSKEHFYERLVSENIM